MHLPNFDWLSIISLSTVKKSKYEYLKPLSCFCSCSSSRESKTLCNLGKATYSSSHSPFPPAATLRALKAGIQPIAGTFITANFLPPFLYISCYAWYWSASFQRSTSSSSSGEVGRSISHTHTYIYIYIYIYISIYIYVYIYIYIYL